MFRGACFWHKWPQAEWADILGDFLEGNALVWYKRLPLVVRSSWDALSSALLEQFKVQETPLVILQQIERVK